MRKSCHHQREREAGHLNLRLTPSPSGSCLSPLIKQRSTPLLICLVSLFLPLPPLPPMSPIYHFSLYSCRANHRKTSDPPWPSCFSLFLLLSIWPDFMNFFCLVLFFLFLSIEKWYYIFVWKLRKCEQQVENVFSIIFSRTQPNTKKYFSKYFLKCHQSLENIFFSEKYFNLKIFYIELNTV